MPSIILALIFVAAGFISGSDDLPIRPHAPVCEAEQIRNRNPWGFSMMLLLILNLIVKIR